MTTHVLHHQLYSQTRTHTYTYEQDQTTSNGCCHGNDQNTKTRNLQNQTRIPREMNRQRPLKQMKLGVVSTTTRYEGGIELNKHNDVPTGTTQ